MPTKHRVLIVGGGFGGLYAAQALRKADVEVTLIDRRNFHLFQPLLYQVATGGLSPANIASPLRAILRRQRNATVLLGEVIDLDLDKKEVVLADERVPYDFLIVATGARHHYFGHPEWEKNAPGLKTIEDATMIRRRVLSAFEEAEREDDPGRVQALLTFTVVGGGPTGVELAGALGEMANHTMRGNFRRINPASAKVYLLEAADRILLSYDPSLSAKATKSLASLGVTVRTNTAVTEVRDGVVVVRQGDRVEEIPCHTVLWGAGVQASPLAKLLGEKTGAMVDRAGRVEVNNDLTLPGRPEVFVLGDMALFPHQTGKPLPGVAQVAMQMGKYAAEVIQRRLGGKAPRGPFFYKDPGSMATIGRALAVAQIGRWKLSGYLAWWAWLLIHILFLIRFENRILVFIQWAWSYFTRGRSARLITQVPSSPGQGEGAGLAR
ncbi:MAG: NAD(P)/FAD-dependent oxidoreductase [Gemmataceae bacterium]